MKVKREGNNIAWIWDVPTASPKSVKRKSRSRVWINTIFMGERGEAFRLLVEGEGLIGNLIVAEK
ncbi:hypothetical protein COLO4_13499 [Corchorus olitorius]|uniref:Uncharacterized protein n=1 Tax=Corchorus olitorius TaxID=93759 RepID=A0A1R3JW98_9ROSI|nr:hypothetical protein COLO4_13499 [Corchorus olitorius]